MNKTEIIKKVKKHCWFTCDEEKILFEEMLNQFEKSILESQNKKYNELLMAVESKYPNEIRHQTALRYIQERESREAESGQESEHQRRKYENTIIKY